ncbi:MAG: general secretion pathway protein G [Candidatus Amesbacteria bacterium GW2011_GWA2_42_12]|uniref:General secretion pathway protein G n=1 Tax=Candidatus Amesbacteria bacterium GW2011_GWA2_42_12 TaxID=1618356 RepID=A0A0G0Y723_9BACT|nr:MAG: general secretion pathway protein G [Candidatus Amesbacteria bacterium GW2011_GWA2_42_12]
MLKLKKGLPAGRQGFTLIELLVVIAVMAVIAGAVLVLIDPVDKISQANDSKVQADIGQIGTALVAYAASHGGNYPCKVLAGCTVANNSGSTGIDELVVSGELSIAPTQPTSYTVYDYAVDTTTMPTKAKISGQQMAKKNTTANVGNFTFCSWLGGAKVYKTAVTTGTAACP